MSICRLPGAGRRRIEVLYKVVGEGTRLLSRQPRGAALATIGPLGNGFRLPAAGRRPRVILIAGGIGIAIFPFLADALLRRGLRPVLLFGARAAADLVYTAPFRARGIPVHVSTEDGSRGARGYVTTILAPWLQGDGPKPLLYACGPTPMLRAVGAMAVRSGAPCQLALESQMPCGIGVCLGCVVACRDEAAGPAYRRVCTEGPIFEAGEVRL
jgi:dihydroorotate dehydrogenase electron transfer subunit